MSNINSNKKLKILLIQLPFPFAQLTRFTKNIPLAAAYLKAMALKEGLLDLVDIEILDGINLNFSSDSRLISLILSRNPDILGFTLYMWNSIRSLFIANEIKKIKPTIKVIVGGPEVTTDTSYLLNASVVDIGCIGEGELTFIEIINCILNRKTDYNDIKGIFYRQGSGIVVNPNRELIRNLDIIPSPYLSGIINPNNYNTFWLEVTRGCHHKCKFCMWGTRPLYTFSSERIKEEMRFALNKGISNIHFLEANFNTIPNFKRICQIIEKINIKRKLILTSPMRAEDIDDETADLLKRCGFVYSSVGLQSCNRVALENVNRRWNLTGFLKGVNNLIKRGIDVYVDNIIALPGDTLADIKNNIKFLEDNNISKKSAFYILSIIPGTRLREEAERYGIKYQKSPPYFVIETNTLNRKDFLKALDLTSKYRLPKYHCLDDPTIIYSSYSTNSYPYIKRSNKLKDLNIVDKIKVPVTKIILDLDFRHQNSFDIISLAKVFSENLGNPLTIWFQGTDINQCLKLIKSFIKSVSRSNPYLYYNIILETKKAFPISILKEIEESILRKAHCIDMFSGEIEKGIRISAIFPWVDNEVEAEWLTKLKDRIQCFWYIEFKKKDGRQDEIKRIFDKKDICNFLIDFDSNSSINFSLDIIKIIAKIGLKDSIIFKNIAIGQSLAIIKTKILRDNELILRPRNLHQYILSLDKNLNISSFFQTERESFWDMVEWLNRFNKVFKLM